MYLPQGIRHSMARYIRACQTGGPRVACGPFEGSHNQFSNYSATFC